MNSFIKIILIQLIFIFFFSINLQAQCESGGHSNTAADNWLSCTTSTNAAGRTGKWIQYDFGVAYNLLTSHFWNYNVVGEVGKGFKDVQIDYSLDGNSWTSFGTFSFAVATGGSDYQGEEGPDFGGIQARYLIITAINNHAADACSGLGELKINIKNCTQLKTGATIQNVTCAKGGAIQLEPQGGVGPFIIQWADAGAESYRSDLVPGNYTVSITDARGCVVNQQVNIPLSDASTTMHTISDLPIPADTFERAGIIASAGFITNTAKVGFRATNNIQLLPGFQATAGCEFTAKIIACVSEEMTAVPEETSVDRSKVIAPTTSVLKEVKPISISLKTRPNPFWDKTIIELSLTTAQNVSIGVFSLLGSEVKMLANDEVLTKGTHQFTFERTNLNTGMYIVKVYNQTTNLSQKIVLLGRN